MLTFNCDCEGIIQVQKGDHYYGFINTQDGMSQGLCALFIRCEENWHPYGQVLLGKCVQASYSLGCFLLVEPRPALLHKPCGRSNASSTPTVSKKGNGTSGLIPLLMLP